VQKSVFVKAINNIARGPMFQTMIIQTPSSDQALYNTFWQAE